MRLHALCVGLLLFLVISHTTYAQQCIGMSTPVEPFAEEVLTISNTALGLTAATYQQTGKVASLAMVSVEQGTIRLRLSANPTATVGHRITAGKFFYLCGIASIKAFKAIREATTDAVLTVSYFKAKSPS